MISYFYKAEGNSIYIKISKCTYLILKLIQLKTVSPKKIHLVFFPLKFSPDPSSKNPSLNYFMMLFWLIFIFIVWKATVC